MSQAVVYLARGIGGGLALAKAFLESYAAHPAGAPHDLIVIAKGWHGQGMDGPAGREALGHLAQAAGASVVDLPDDGFDWGAYMRIAAIIEHEWVCFLNTHSQIQADNWLLKLATAAQQPGVGAAGATASFGTLGPIFEFILPKMADELPTAGLIKTSARALFHLLYYIYQWPIYRPVFPPFPNAHLRSNAFLLQRETFLRFAATAKMPNTKFEAFALESGRKGLTRFLTAEGTRVIIVGRDGNVFEQAQWVESGTFWVPGQPNLLISDNQTHDYTTVSVNMRRGRERNAWGRAFTLVTADRQGTSHERP
jgi:hypothetical protein